MSYPSNKTTGAEVMIMKYDEIRIRMNSNGEGRRLFHTARLAGEFNVHRSLCHALRDAKP